MWQRLRNRQLARWKFRRQHPIGKFIVDFVTLDGKLVVEVDGETHGSEQDAARDAERTRMLDSFGFRVVRATNVDVYTNIDGGLAMIARELRQRPD